ncbi:MAG: hypothetical protein JXA99_01135 [Candidatus Lokiarchaeota archaeon]|nr:hypothetical protein [Candidatus Lokiarchaeota archaeon]
MKAKIELDAITLDLIDKGCRIYQIKEKSYPVKIRKLCVQTIKKFFDLSEIILRTLTTTFRIVEKHCPEILEGKLSLMGELLIYYRNIMEDKKNAENITKIDENL